MNLTDMSDLKNLGLVVNQICRFDKHTKPKKVGLDSQLKLR